MKDNKPRCAVISTWKIDCGIAAFAHKMVPGLEEKFDVDVFALDQSILKASDPQIVKRGHLLIKDIASKIADYDLVNIQFEPGIYGNKPPVIYKRIYTLINSSKHCYITFHTVRQGGRLSLRKLSKLAVTRPMKALDYFYSLDLNKCYNKLYNKINTTWKNKVFCHYHTKSAKRYVNLFYPNIKTIDFPLTFLNLESKAKYKKSVSEDKNWLLQKFQLADDTVIISAYGFISKYKDFETVIKAIYQLPINYKLCIFGSIHPNNIQLNVRSDQYLNSLIELILQYEAKIPVIMKKIMDSNNSINLGLQDIKSAYTEESRTMKFEKVVFGGSLNDDDFTRAMNGSDINVMPYLEVGQTSSGPMSISLDLSKKTIATYNKCFLQHKKYAQDSFDQFDIGNYIHLKNIIKLSAENNQANPGLEKYTNTYTLENRVKQIHDTYIEMTEGNK